MAITAATATLGLLASSAAASPAPVPGWPIAAPAGDVVAHTGGVVVVGGPGDPGSDGPFAAVAVRPDGTRMWTTILRPGCGNCDGEATPMPLADGDIGPIGFLGDAVWALDGAGRPVDGCTGAVFADGTCAALDTAAPTLTFRASRDGATVWTSRLAGLRTPPGDVPPAIVADRRGALYVGTPAFVWGVGERVPARLVSLDAGTGAVRWQRPGGGGVLAGLGSGALVATDDAVVAVDALGRDRWAVPWPGGRVRVARTLVDATRGVAYLTRSGVASPGRRLREQVVAIDLRTGAVRWRSSRAEGARAVALVRGAVLVAATRGARHQLRAHAPGGRLRWRFRSATRVAGAAPFRDGTVAVSLAGPLRFADWGALLVRIDPRRTAARVRTPRISLGARRARIGCGPDGCDVGPAAGTRLSIALPRPASLRVRLLAPGGATFPVRGRRPITIAAPAGRSFARIVLTGGPAVGPGRRVVEVRWRDRGRAEVRRLPVTLVRTPR